MGRRVICSGRLKRIFEAIAKASLIEKCQIYGRSETKFEVDFIINHIGLELSLTFYALIILFLDL